MYRQPAGSATYGARPAPELVQRLLIGAFGWMFAGLLLTAGVAFAVQSSTTLTNAAASLWLPLMIGQLVLGFVLGLGINKMSASLALLLFFVYAASMGLTIGIIVQFYTTASVVTAFLSASAMFGGAAVFGKVTNRDLSGIGSIAVMALFGVIVASLLNGIFFRSTQMDWLVSLVGVGVFAILTAWNVQRLTNGQLAAVMRSAEHATVFAAFQLYLDFINLFLFLLRLFGNRR
ncbi:MAG: Bax inhibitor-1/YccA family protein [Chloroflexota bacterium]